MNNNDGAIIEEELIEVFSDRHPYLKEKLRALSAHFASKGGLGVFAPIEGDTCGACRVKIASARLQGAKIGLFISCANCARFLYMACKIFPRKSHAPIAS